MLSCRQSFCRARSASSNNIPTQRRTIRVDHFEPSLSPFLLLLVERLFFCYRVGLWTKRSTRVMRPLTVLTRFYELFRIVCQDSSWPVLHDDGVPVIISWLIIEVQDLMIRCKKFSKCGGRWDPTGAYERFVLASGAHGLRHPAYLTIRIFWKCVNTLWSPFGLESLALCVPGTLVFLSLA